MIELRTGLPGAGKTLFALKQVRDLAEKDGRQVYYFNIAELSVPGWIEVTLDEAREWYKLPAGSVLIIDEAQKLFRPRPAGSAVPPAIAEMEEERHRGVDLVLITQHPGLLDSNVRKLVGRHFHYVRAFGSTVVVQHEWAECKGDVDKTRADSLKTTLNHPKEVYGWYKSAEVHTFKRKIPARVLALAVIPFLLLGLGWATYSWFGSRLDGHSPVAALKGPGVDTGPVQRPAAPVLDYIEAQKPRVQGLAFTAPAYDQAMAVKAAPFPSACVASSSRCTCYTDQATVLDMADSLCRDIVVRGAFDPRGLQGGKQDMQTKPDKQTPQPVGPGRLPA